MKICSDVVLWTGINAYVVEVEFCLEHEAKEGDSPVDIYNLL